MGHSPYCPIALPVRTEERTEQKAKQRHSRKACNNSNHRHIFSPPVILSRPQLMFCVLYENKLHTLSRLSEGALKV